MEDTFIDIAQNRKARFEYEIIETFETGIVLKGTEVKSLRARTANISDAFVTVRDGEAFIHQMSISPYEMGNRFNHDSMRVRKLLLHRKQIDYLFGKVREKGLTLIPLKLYFKNGKAKFQIALAKGKAQYDKRRSIKERESKREVARALKDHR
ncbi:MAG TPA: SsrA-binding protein SmpB [Spirochaetota bacterium]|nr:SsrA-binding protein SmpB [Spirochaetota bacterium]